MEVYTKTVQLHNGFIGELFGKFDENMKKIENTLSVQVVNRGEDVVINGTKASVIKAEAVIVKLVKVLEKGERISEQMVSYVLASSADENFDDIEKMNDETICMTISGRPIKPKTLGQKAYFGLMKSNVVTFCIGPAGTGKTYLAMAMAITAFKKNEVSRIILTRPVIEAGEKLGFLPGDLQQKVDPYLRPLYDALYEIMGAETFQRNMEKGAIEVAPLAYMRGRTLDNAYIVLDEAQNTTREQMKMFLTRIGFGSKTIITGDLTQIDLPEGKGSGLTEAVAILNNIEGIAISRLTNRDIVRHPLVQQIVNAYEKNEAKNKDSVKKVTRYYGKKR